MKSAAAGTASGCVVWMIVFCIMSMCSLSAVMAVGAFTTTADFTVQIMGRYLCPPNSTAETITHPSTSTDSSGHTIPSTAYEMQCVDAEGNIVRAPSPDYAFIWLGILAAAALLLSVLFAFLLAAPAGVLIANLLNRIRKNNAARI
jgi:hypothetical protein